MLSSGGNAFSFLVTPCVQNLIVKLKYYETIAQDMFSVTNPSIVVSRGIRLRF